MKHLYSLGLICLTLFVHSNAFSQTYGNEWINYSNKFYQFKIVNEGIYKIDYQTLQNSGVPMSQLTPSNLQIFGRDREQPIVVFDGGDNSFDSNDYFLFFAQRNDGWLDSTLYEDPTKIGNPGYSIFNDTIIYFFSWSNQGTNLRYSVEAFNNYSSYTVSNYVLNKTENIFSNAYNIAFQNEGILLSQFTAGEGYSSPPYNGGDGTNGFDFPFSISTPNVYTGTGAPNAVFHGKSNSNSSAAASTDININPDGDNHHLQWIIGGSNHVLVDTTFYNYRQIVTNTSFHPIFLESGATLSRFKIIDDLDAVTDYQSISYCSLYYPMTPNFGGVNKTKFYIRNQVQAFINLELSGLSMTSPVMLVSGGLTPKIVLPTLEGGLWKALVSPSNNGTDQQVVMYDMSQVVSITHVDAVNGTGTFTDFSQVDFDSSNIIIYHPSLLTASQAYRDYRAQDYNVIFANIEELYLQFGGGIQKHNAAIRRFSNKVYNQSTEKPLAITLLGKGYSTANLRLNPTYFNACLIPTFGYPGSDISYTTHLNGNGYEPLIPIGRVSVTNETDLTNYLNKLITYEAAQNACPAPDWQKQVIHFVGGNPGPQNDTFKVYMNEFAGVIEGTNYAGNVTTYSRETDDPFDPSVLAQLAEQLETGVSLINFFGHSSANGFDITVDEPQNWNNNGKYPVVVGNGCHSGDIFNTDNSFGEKLIRTQNEGAIAYIGSTDQEYDLSVYRYCGELYDQFSITSYGMPLGMQIKQTIKRMQEQNFFGYAFMEGTVNATNLDGDPLIKLNWHDKPELEITDNSIFISPNEIDLTVDTFEVNIVIKNYGAAVTDTFNIEVTRDFPGSDVDFSQNITYSSFSYIDTLVIKFPLDPNVSIGLNTITVKVDDPSLIEEMCDDNGNNTVVKSFYLKVDGLIPVYPYEFAVVPKDTITVKASTLNPIAGVKTYFIELDTTDLFNSPQKRSFTKTGMGGVIEVPYDQWKDGNGNPFPLICEDSMVYFWRTTIDSSVLVWNESSFQYIKDKEGWGQDHFFQNKNNAFYSINYDRTLRERRFEPLVRNLACNIWDTPQGIELGQNLYTIDLKMMEYGSCYIPDGLHLVVIDPVTLLPWHTLTSTSPDGHFLGRSPCRGRPENYFIFQQDDAQSLANLASAIRDSIPCGHYIMLYTVSNAMYDSWDALYPEIYNVFAELGSTQIVQSGEDRAFIMFAQKCNSNYPVSEVIANSPSQQITFTTQLNGQANVGLEKGPLIGPALDWKTLYWKQHPYQNDTINGDSTLLTIDLYNIYGAKVGEIDTMFTLNDSIIDLGNLINPVNYPFISLNATYTDSTEMYPAQIDRWHVLYTPVPEAAIDGSNGYSLFPQMDTIPEGQEFNFAVDIRNISDYPMDSLLVSYWIVGSDNVKHYVTYPRQAPLLADQTLRDTVLINTMGLSGLSSLWVEVNPYIDQGLSITDQPEQYHFNNLLQIPFYVRSDDENPILDVTFDGVHILNGDIVSPTSEILITLKDDNDFLIMDDVSDTTLFGVYLTKPDGVQHKIPFTNLQGEQIMQWFPAEPMYKKFKILYPAVFDQDGVYTLEVQGADRSGNLSGDLKYKISFEVIHEASITYLMNYPNPFSTSTRFVFTLTGSEIPEDFLIQIMTVSGKVVRQINEQELGPIHIGRNITEFAWDGTDDFGDPLANGVYLYRVMSRLNGEEIKHRETDGDKYFTKEFGKMYIIR